MGGKLEIKVKIVNQLGLHARPAAMFVETAGKFKKCEIYVYNNEKYANGKSIMGMMMLEASSGTELRITAQGEDAEKALEAIAALINNKFDEE